MSRSKALAEYLQQPDLLGRDATDFVGQVSSTVIQTLAADFRHLGNELTPFQQKWCREGRGGRLVLDGRVLEEFVGRGAQADVYKAYNVSLERNEAVKIIRRELLDEFSDEDHRRYCERFVRGARAGARLSHENIAAVFDFNRSDYWLAMEYVEGPSLSQLMSLTQGRGLEMEVAVDYTVQTARGMHFAHTRETPVIHRDVKPSNLILDEPTGRIKIVDFGLARIDEICETETIGTGAGSSTVATHDRITQDGMPLGSVHFMPPEQHEDAHHADQRSDIYSLGCTLHSLLTSKVMYKYETATLVMLAHEDDPIPSIREHRPDVPDELDRVYRQMVAKQPDERYQSMSEVIEALASLSATGTRVAAT